VFGNNSFSLASVSVGGKPSNGQQNPMQGTIPTQGSNPRIPSSQGPWNPWKGLVPFSRMLTGGNPFHSQWNPEQGSGPMPVRSVGGNPSQNPWNLTQAQPSTSYYERQSMMSQQM
jgi:hypothetical protein